jgi:hypothetical protein
LRSKLRAVPVEAAGEAGAAEFRFVEGEFRLRDPVRERRDLGAAVEDVGRGAPQKEPQKGGGVGRQLGVGDSRRLEVEDVEELVAEDVLHPHGRRFGRARPERDAHRGEPAEPFRRRLGEVPGNDRSPVVADDNGPVLTQYVQQTHQVIGQMDDVVLLHPLRS